MTFSEWIDMVGKESSVAGKYTIILVMISLCATLLTNTAIHQFFGGTNLNLLPDGTYCYYVDVTNSYDKEYTLPAEVVVEIETDYNSDNNSIFFSAGYRHYYVKKVFFPNGGYLNTEDSSSCVIDEPFYVTIDDEEWEIVLHNRPAYSPYVKETNNTMWFDITVLSVELLSTFIISIALIKYQNKKKDNAT